MKPVAAQGTPQYQEQQETLAAQVGSDAAFGWVVHWSPVFRQVNLLVAASLPSTMRVAQPEEPGLNKVNIPA
jgi:hypothetical protein